MADVDLSADFLNAVMDSPKVRAQLNAKARRVLASAQRLAYKANRIHMAQALHIEDGTRPGSKSPTGLKRSFSGVTFSLTKEQWIDDALGSDESPGKSTMTVTEIMRRASRA